LKVLKFILLISIFTACTNDSIVVDDILLSNYILNRTIEKGAVIACAGSNEDASKVLVFEYPANGAINTKLYETETINVDESDFTNYTKVRVEGKPFFNGYLQQFDLDLSIEKWIIVTHELDGEIKISNPIRTKQLSKASNWTDEVDIDQDVSTMPKFNWEKDQFGDNAIYFQIVSDEQNNLLSGTYTLESTFQYYNTSNVVLNITTETPPTLLIGAPYNFTLMDVSEDNWVNLFILNKSFIAE